MDNARFTVFGVDLRRDVLIEIQTNLYTHAVELAHLYSCVDYRARIWDKFQKGFVKY